MSKGKMWLQMYRDVDKILVEILENYHWDDKDAGWVWDASYAARLTDEEMIKILMDSGLLKKKSGSKNI